MTDCESSPVPTESSSEQQQPSYRTAAEEATSSASSSAAAAAAETAETAAAETAAAPDEAKPSCSGNNMLTRFAQPQRDTEQQNLVAATSSSLKARAGFPHDGPRDSAPTSPLACAVVTPSTSSFTATFPFINVGLRCQEGSISKPSVEKKKENSRNSFSASLAVTSSTIRRYPSILIMPLLLSALLIGLGVFAVASWEKAELAKQRDDALHMADSTLSAFSLTVQQAYISIAVLGKVVDLTRQWQYTLGNFSSSIQEMETATMHQSGSLHIEVQLAPQFVISAVYPETDSPLLGVDLLDPVSCPGCADDSLRQFTQDGFELLQLNGPYDLGRAGDIQMVLIASLPIYLNSTYNGSGLDPAWGLPAIKGSCPVPQCSVEVAPGLYRKWYGFAFCLIYVSSLLQCNSTQLPHISSSGWVYAIRRKTPIPMGTTHIKEWVSPDGLPPSTMPTNPVVVSTAIGALGGGNIEFEFMLAPESGWSNKWWPAVYVAVILAAIVISVLFFFMLKGRRQNTWLLYSILPKQVVKSLRSGGTWSQQSDCCVLFADVVGFTHITSTMSLEAIASMMGDLFRSYEDLCAMHGVTKVDIIGDCFMAASGLDLDEGVPNGKSNVLSAVKVAALALGMVEACKHVTTPDGEPLAVRIGLHAGPVMAMLVGDHSPKLTVFGDVVNICSRMESTSLPGRIQVSSIVAERLIDAEELAAGMALVERGEVELRNRGTAWTWWLRSSDELVVDPPHHVALPFSSIVAAHPKPQYQHQQPLQGIIVHTLLQREPTSENLVSGRHLLLALHAGPAGIMAGSGRGLSCGSGVVAGCRPAFLSSPVAVACSSSKSFSSPHTSPACTLPSPPRCQETGREPSKLSPRLHNFLTGQLLNGLRTVSAREHLPHIPSAQRQHSMLRSPEGAQQGASTSCGSVPTECLDKSHNPERLSLCKHLSLMKRLYFTHGPLFPSTTEGPSSFPPPKRAFHSELDLDPRATKGLFCRAPLKSVSQSTQNRNFFLAKQGISQSPHLEKEFLFLRRQQIQPDEDKASIF